MPTEHIVTSDRDHGPFMTRCIRSLVTETECVVRGYTDGATAHFSGWADVKAGLPSVNESAPKPTNYIWNAQRYAVKCFVWWHEAERMQSGVLVWLDADTYATQPIPTGFFTDLLGDADVAYLGRQTMHPETGFVVFRLPEALPLIRWCKDAYATGAFRELKDGWTDCHVFRAGLKANPTIKARDLTSHLLPEGNKSWNSKVDAFAVSPLGPYLVHLKGRKRKRESLCAS